MIVQSTCSRRIRVDDRHHMTVHAKHWQMHLSTDSTTSTVTVLVTADQASYSQVNYPRG
jgi:hypothetical protein